MRHKMITLCMTVFLILSCSLTVFAQGFESGKTGSVFVTLTKQSDKAPIVGAELSMYHIATPYTDENGNLDYIYTDIFDGIGMELDDPLLTSSLDAYVVKNQISPIIMTTNENGTATCDNLVLGLYFIRQTGAAKGIAPCVPFIVAVPCISDNGYVYEVKSTPKTAPSKHTDITIQKVWNTDTATKVADSVTVQLLQNGNVLKTATLNAQNNWKITYTGMPESDAYSIREVNVPVGFTATYSQTGYVFTVTNSSNLIQTGQLVWPIPVLAVSGMLLIAVGVLLLQKKREINA